MRAILFLALICAVFANFHADSEWQSYKSSFGKKYADEKEEGIRYGHFLLNKDRAAFYGRLNPDATFGHTRFSDLSPQEFRSMYLNFRPSQMIKVTGAYKAKGIAVPDNYDWRDNGAVTPIKDQSQCGSCYIFSVVGNIEGVWKTSGHALVALAEQQVLDCDKVDDGCGGGWMWNVYDYVKTAGGLEKMSDYPYKAKVGACKFDKAKIEAKITGYINVTTTRDEAAMQEYCLAHGPLSVAVDATPFQYYSGGVITGGCGNTFDDLDHAVMATGWGVTTDSKKQSFWWIKNSWGRSWGESGYCRLLRNKNTCGVAWVPTSATA